MALVKKDQFSSDEDLTGEMSPNSSDDEEEVLFSYQEDITMSIRNELDVIDYDDYC
jgi:hypothetical protein